MRKEGGMYYNATYSADQGLFVATEVFPGRLSSSSRW